MKIELTKKESGLIIAELICSLNSIQHVDSRKKKGEFKSKSFDKFSKEDFDLKEACFSDYEFKCYFGLLQKLRSNP